MKWCLRQVNEKVFRKVNEKVFKKCRKRLIVSDLLECWFIDKRVGKSFWRKVFKKCKWRIRLIIAALLECWFIDKRVCKRFWRLIIYLNVSIFQISIKINYLMWPVNYSLNLNKNYYSGVTRRPPIIPWNCRRHCSSFFIPFQWLSTSTSLLSLLSWNAFGTFHLTIIYYSFIFNLQKFILNANIIVWVT